MGRPFLLGGAGAGQIACSQFVLVMHNYGGWIEGGGRIGAHARV